MVKRLWLKCSGLEQLLIISLLPALFGCQEKLNYRQVPNGINISTPEGTLGIYPVSDNAVRIKFINEKETSVPEFVLRSDNVVPEFQIYETLSKIAVRAKNIHVLVDRKTGRISFSDPSGKIFLCEKTHSRKLLPDSVMGEPCYLAEQSFESPPSECIFGLGQFQDGHYNLKGISRRLTQVNSQIAIPFIYSNRGYGLLWHQYGLTDFNPADNFITLEKKGHSTLGDNQIVEVITTSGTQKISQEQSVYIGSFNVPTDGEYSIFLDLGDMGNRQLVVIDGEPCIDQNNLWLPPAVSTLVNLKAGGHHVQVVCKSDNNPKLSWKLKDHLTTFRSPNAKMLDYVVFYGPSADTVIASYRRLSGQVPMLPLWAYGFWQCRERYTSGNHLVETVKEFRRRNLPMDVIVQDWQYWGNKGWGVPVFDETHYPNPSGFIKELHDLNAHFNISIWSNPDKNSTIGKEYAEKNRYLKDSKWLDYFNPETRKEYWNTLKENLFDHGVDSWWMDATEPENDALRGVNTYIGLGDFYRLTYPLLVCQAVYEGQRKTTNDKRVCILTRSAFLGQQKYGSINWSGDIGGTWDAYKRQIVAGLNYTITGLPYWTTDIGGFFRPGSSQYSDAEYHELLTRWFQWGAFNPVFRIHGYQTETESWKYGPVVEDHMRKMLDLRYRLLPCIYSEAWQVTSNGSTIMRPLVMDFREDTNAIDQPYEYMFGKSILVAPVTEPGVTGRDVYLPRSTDWYDFWTGKRYNGGQTIKTEASLDKIPLFIKAGTILPMGKFIQYAQEKLADTLEIRIYRGANGQFDLYEDEGDNYNYEKGKYTIIPFIWDEKNQSLTIGKRRGSYPGYLISRAFNVVLVSEAEGIGISVSDIIKQVSYTGTENKIKYKIRSDNI
jgi:alpha-D-xyloside xylohydrolase